jgi:general secretion pathway protein D
MMKKQTATPLHNHQRRSGWHRLGAFALLCAVAVAPNAQTAPAASQASANLNFVGADIESVIKAVGHYTNINFLIDPRVKGTINLVSEKPLTKAQAFNLLTSALRMQGYAVVSGDGYTKVVPEADAKLQPGPTQAAPAAPVKGDQIATQIFRLNHESSVNLVPVLRPLISPNNTINANPSNNTLVITDYADNLRRLGKIIAALDSPAGGEPEIIPMKHAIATDIAVMVNRLLEPGAAAAGTVDAGRVSLLADSRTNSIIVRAPSAARANLAKSLIAKLDQPTAQPGNVHVVYLRNADALRLAQTLRAVVAADTSTPAAPATNQAQSVPPPASGGGLQAPPPAQQSTTPAALPTGGTAGFIQADPATNTLIITASETVYRNLRTVIDLLDVRRAQVYVESLIVEVTADKAAEFGIQWLGLSGDSSSNYRVGGGTSFSTGGNNIISQAVAQNAGTPLAPGNGLTIGIFRQIGGRLGLGALAHALETDANANILSMPNLITLDNEEAKIIVGQNVPFITGQYTTAASGGSAGVNPFQTIERKDVGLSLRVRPQISEGGTVRMAIYQETSAVQDSSNAAGIITSKRSIDTNVLVDDGQIVVLGGLIEDTVSDNVEKVTGLGDIPIIGNLFKYQKRGRKKTNLMVFLRPTVIRSNDQSVNLAGDRYDYIRNVELATQPAPSVFLPDTGAPVLPPLEDGRPVGGALQNTLPLPNPAVPATRPVPQM